MHKSLLVHLTDSIRLDSMRLREAQHPDRQSEIVIFNNSQSIKEQRTFSNNSTVNTPVNA